MKINRMDLDDIGNKPIPLAKELLNQIGRPSGATPLEEISKAIDIVEIKYDMQVSFEGALFSPEGKAYGSIIINPSKGDHRARFTLGHEIGHYLLPFHHGEFACFPQDINQGNYGSLSTEQKLEFQANQFAAELLLPSSNHLIDEEAFVNMSCEQICAMTQKYQVSAEMGFRRMCDLSEFPMSVFFFKDKKLRYFYRSDCFPFPKINKKHSQMPIHCASSELSFEENSCSSCQVIDWQIWLYNFDRRSLIEQTFMQENGFQVVLLKLI